MNTCRWKERVERWFDGEGGEDISEAVKDHVDQCPKCAATVAGLRSLRQTAAQMVRHEEIGDGQFAAFMAGVRDGVQVRQRGWGRFWAFASVAAAALIAAASAFVIISDEPQTVDATVVESCTTDLQGATVSTYEDDGGDTTIAVTMSKDDIW